MTTIPQPGEFGVVRTHGFVGASIRLATRSPVSHAFIVLEDGHTTVEAERKGATYGDVSKYADRLVVYSDIHYLLDRSAQRVCDAARSLIGTPYNFVDIGALGLLSLGVRNQWLIDRAQDDGRLICSQLVDRAFELAGIHLFADKRPDGLVTPLDLLLLVAEDVPTHVGGRL